VNFGKGENMPLKAVCFLCYTSFCIALLMNPESFGPMDPSQDPIEGSGDISGFGGASAPPKSGPPAGDAIFEAVARRNEEMNAIDEVVAEKKTFIDVGLKFHVDLLNMKDKE
jgi:hypothetical protein